MSDSTPASTDAATAASTPSAPTAAPAAVHDPIRTLLEKAREEISRNALAEAAQTLNQAQRQRPGDARVFMMAGLMAEKSGNVAGAFDALRKCVALSPDWGPGLLELALLAPIVMQFLAQRAATGQLDASSLGNALGQEPSRPPQPPADVAGSLLTGLLDQNRDGKLDAGDLLQLGAGLLRGRR